VSPNFALARSARKRHPEPFPPPYPLNHRMHSFSEQCLDMARSILGHNLDSIQPDGTVLPAPWRESRPDEPGHVAFALGEYYRATGETTLKGFDI
jgi:hypothetical protein